MNPPPGSNGDPSNRNTSNTSIAFGVCLITLGSKTKKNGISAVVVGSVAIAIGSGALNSLEVKAEAFAMRVSASLNVAYSNVDTMNLFEG
ncbi:hypothetical protein ACHAPA_001609 [Fusarium lateritium]